MKTASILFLVTMSLCLTPAVFGQRAMDEAETEVIITQLLSQPRTTWISAGTITATHYEQAEPRTTDSTVIQAEIDEAVAACKQKIEANPLPENVEEDIQKLELEAAEFNVRYELANKYTMTSTETVEYDGERFSWDITVTSRSDSMSVDSALAGNYMVRHYDVHKKWNQHRVFAWDGQEYTCYSASGDYAAVYAADAIEKKHRPVNGPLTAGLIPWGNGRFSKANLSAADISADEISLDGSTYVQMTISHTDGSVSELVLDKSKDYAVTSATLRSHKGSVVTYTCSGYHQPVSDQWIPTTVAVEREIDSIWNKMPTYELWSNITVSNTTPSSFDVSLLPDVAVEHFSPVTASSAIYVNSYETDADNLLIERLAYAAMEGRRPQNCATVALQHVASEFGKSVSSADLTDLVDENGRTSLYDLKQSAQKLGLYASAVATDLATLRTLGAAQVILYLPSQNHFVVLDRVDERSVWLVNLSGRKFYYQTNASLFPLDWSTGIALLVSEQPLSGQLSELSDAVAKEITGGYWECATLYQESYWEGCDWEPYTYCYGECTYYYERWVCNTTDSGSCPSGGYPLYQSTPCIPDPIVDCTVTGAWTFVYMRACA